MKDTPKTIVSKDGSLVWNVVEVEYREEGLKRKINRVFFTVACSRCGYRFTATRGNLEARKACPGCAEKPAAVKMDSAGHCISICEIGTVEFIREYQNQHDVSEREAVRQFIETAKAHLSPDDPIAEKLTEESINAKVRRLTGKKKDRVKVCGDPPQVNEQDKPVPTAKLHVIENGIVYDGIRFGEMAIAQLERIKKEDPQRVATLQRVIDRCEEMKAETLCNLPVL